MNLPGPNGLANFTQEHISDMLQLAMTKAVA